MAGKTKTIILEEKLKEKEVEHYTDNLDVERLRVLKEIAETSYVYSSQNNTEPQYDHILNDKGREIIANKIIEIVKRM